MVVCVVLVSLVDVELVWYGPKLLTSPLLGGRNLYFVFVGDVQIRVSWSSGGTTKSSSEEITTSASDWDEITCAKSTFSLFSAISMS